MKARTERRQIGIMELYACDVSGKLDAYKKASLDFSEITAYVTLLIEEEIIWIKHAQNNQDPYSLFEGVVSHLEEIDNEIARVATDWPVDDIGLISKEILRISLYEILYDEEIPPAVAADEAVELAKRFGDGEEGSVPVFVNGVLGTVLRERGLGR